MMVRHIIIKRTMVITGMQVLLEQLRICGELPIETIPSWQWVTVVKVSPPQMEATGLLESIHKMEEIVSRLSPLETIPLW